MQVLGLENLPRKETTLAAAYGRAAKKAHPDASGSASQFIAVEAAYDHLKTRGTLDGGAVPFEHTRWWKP